MSNQGRVKHTEEHELQEMEARRARTAQPNQHGLKKVVHSKPMDLTRVQQTNNPMNSELFGGSTAVNDSMKGGRIVKSLKDSAILDTLNQNELSASVQNADLRKKLRVDRVKKMQMQFNVGGSIEDSSQPDWLKKKSLREIEVIRETKKNDIIHRVLGDGSGANVKTMAITPG